MFQSIKYLNRAYDNKTNLYTHNYELIDSDFTSQFSVTTEAGWVAAEYENRKTNHKEIIKNLFLWNMFILKQKWGYKDINQILEYQHKYLINKYYPGINFREKYYNDLVKYTKKMMVIS